MHYRNLIKLSSVELDEATNVSWLQAMPLGTYHHPVHGPIEFNAENLAEYAAGVNNRIRTNELDIDYDHKKYGGDAAGWVKKAEVREDGLWLAVEWTKTAFQKIKERAYKYFSPEFIEKWVDPKTKQEHKHVLMGGAITNRPFLRDIATLNLTEEPTEELMSKELAKLLGLPEDADEAAIIAKVTESVTTGASGDAASSTQEPQPLNKPKPQETTTEPQLVSATETKPSDDPVIVNLVEEVTRLKFANKLMETEAQVAKLSETGGRKFAIPPVLLTEVRDIMVAAPTKELSEQVFNVFEKITKDGLIELGERGHQDPDTTNSTAAKRWDAACQKYMAEHKDVSVADALEAVSMAEPNLWEDYLVEQNGGGR